MPPFCPVSSVTLSALDGVAFVIGAMTGSFLNVCIYRLPLGRSVIRPRSSCPACGALIRAYDNVPLLSFVLLRGRCRDCRAPVSWRYPAIELLTAVLAVAILRSEGLSLHAAAGFCFVSALLTVSVIDLDHQIIPDRISLPGIVLGFACALLLGRPPWTESLIGLLVGGGSLWAVAEGYYRITGREGMGGGDVKLLAMIGAFLGWRALPVTLMLASFGGSLVGLALIVTGRRGARVPIPFGPFLAAGAVCALFFGDSLLAWYLGLMRLGG